MNADLLTPLLQCGIAGIMLAIFIGLHWRSLKSSETREAKMEAQLETNRKECRADTDRLTGRIEKVEDHSRTTLAQIATTSAAALRDTAAAMRKFAEADTERIERQR